MTLDEARAGIGRHVIYLDRDGGRPEDGVITSVNSRYVFVQYTGQHQSKATRPDDLRFQWEEG